MPLARRTPPHRHRSVAGSWPGLAALLLCFGTMHAACAQSVVIYRCTDASGALTIQNGTPCPKGSRQQVQTIEAPMVIPRYEAPPAIVTSVPEPQPEPAREQPQAPSPRDSGSNTPTESTRTVLIASAADPTRRTRARSG